MVSKADLDYAILSMAAYDVGGNTTISRMGDTFGDATVIASQQDVNSGFSATAFSYGGKIVISYRGTDADEILTDGANAYLIGAGASALAQIQAVQAIKFYQTIAGLAGADLYSASIELTGHSLGGGLAGYVAAVYGKSAVVFDNMPFETSSSDDVNLASHPETEAGALARNLLYPDADTNFVPRPANFSKISSYATTGELLEAVRIATLEDGSTHYLDSNAENANPINLHSIALQVDLNWASINESGSWMYGAVPLWKAYFSKAVGDAIPEAQNLSGGPDGTNTAIIDQAIAFSAISTGERPFGDSALYAMFDDAADIGVGEKSLNPSNEFTDVDEILGEISVEYAAKLALSGTLISGDSKVTEGALSSSSDRSTVSVDFSDSKWRFDGISQESSFKNDLITTLANDSLGVSTFADEINKYNYWVGKEEDSNFKSITGITIQTDYGSSLEGSTLDAGGLAAVFLKPNSRAIQVGNVAGLPTEDRAIVGSSQSDTVYGQDENDLLIGADGNDNLISGGGRNTFFGGNGDDRVYSEGEDDFIDGGAGNDVIHLKSTAATIEFGAGDGSDVVEFDNGDGDYNLALQNLNPSDIELIAGGRDVYDGWGQGQEPDGFWYQFITVRVKATGDQITFLENGPNIGPDGNGSANAYNKSLDFYDPDYVAGQATENQGKLDRITFSDGTVLNQSTLWSYISDSQGDINKPDIDTQFDYWSTTPEIWSLDGLYFINPSFVPNVTLHSAGSYLDYVNRTYLQADPISAPPPPPGQTVTGTPGDDSIAPGYGDDTVTGGQGNDTIAESPGNDTYVWNTGDGNDTIAGAGPNDGFNTLALGAGIAASDVQYTVTRDGAGLVLKFAGQAGSVTLANELVGTGLGVDQIQFADGSTLSRADMLVSAASGISDATQVTDGTDQNDTFFPLAGNFVIDGGKGDDETYVGSGGSGTFKFSKNYGHDVIHDYGTGYSREDVLDLVDANPGDVQLTRSGNALLVTIVSTGASVNVQNQFAGSEDGEEHGLGTIKFADGSIWTRAQILGQVLGITDDSPPKTEASSASAVEDAAIVRGTLPAVDPDQGDTLTFTLDTPVDGLVVASDGSWSFNPTASAYQHLTDGEQLTVTANYHVTDQAGASSSSTLTINLTGTNDMPTVVQDLGNQRLADDVAFTYDVSSHFADRDDGALVLTATLYDGSALPDWLVFQNGQFAGTAPDGTSAVLNVVVTASDGMFNTSSSFLLHIGPDNQAPAVSEPLQNATGNVNSPLDIVILPGTFVDPDGDALTLTATLADGTALPSWLSLSNGHLVGTPPGTAAGSYDIKVIASDGDASTSSTFSLSLMNYEPGTSGDDSYDLTTGFAIRGGLGDDYYSVTGDGAGTFYFSKGDGHDVLDQPDGGVRSDTLVLTDIASNDVTLTRTDDAAEILVKSTGDSFTVDWQFYGEEPDGVPQGLGQIQFADGVTWDRAEIERQANGGGSSGPDVNNGIADSTVYRGQAVDIAIPPASFSNPSGTLIYSATLADGSALPSWLSLDDDHLVGTVPDAALGVMDVRITATDGSQSASGVFKLTATVETGDPITSDQWQLVTDGNDRILDNGGNTSINGFGGDDVITLDAWNVSANGGDGNDVFEMFGDGDNATGGDGADTFLFDSGALVRSSPNPDAWATVNDFAPGEDRIGILNGTGGVTSYADLQQYMSQSGSAVLIQFQGLPTITLANVLLTDLSAADFLFTEWASTGASAAPPPAGIVPYPATANTVDLYNGTGDLTGGNDRVLGNGAGNMQFNALAGDDYITTDGWNVTAYGGRGDDVFEINGTVNTIIGGPGYDYYVFDSTEITSFSDGDTWATIADYADGVDKIVFRNGTGGMADFNDLGQYMAQDGSDVTITLPDLPAIRLTNVSLGQLDASDFIFESGGGSPQASATVMTSSTRPGLGAASLTPDMAARISGGPARVLLSKDGRTTSSTTADLTSIQKAAAMLTEASARFGVGSPTSEWHDSVSDTAWQHRQHALTRPTAALL